MIGPYELPRAFESEELTAVLTRLTPRQRRVLREYVERVELGELSVTAWLADERCPVTERSWYRRGPRAGFRNCQAFQDALTAYLRAAIRAGADEEARAIAAAKRRIRLKAERAAERITDQVDGSIGQFFRSVERWTMAPLPSQEILREEVREYTDERGKQKTGMFYLVRQTVLDVGKVTDPVLARLVRKFEDGPKGLKLELYDALRAAETILDRADMETAAKGEIGVEVSDARERLARLLGADAADGAEAGGAGEAE